MGAHLFPFREAEVIASAEAEASPTDAYLAAAEMIPAYARRWTDAEDVASLARLLLASVMAEGLSGSLAAGAAVKRAAERMAEQSRKHAAEVAAGDTRDLAEGEARDTLARTHYARPDGCATYSEADALADVLAAAEVTAEGVALLALLAREAEAWGGGHGAQACDPSGPGLAALLAGHAVKRGRKTASVAESARDALAACRDALGYVGDVEGVSAWRLPARNGADAAHAERGLVRDSRQATSGPASHVVVTRPDGARWLCLPNVWHRVTDEAAAAALAYADALPAYTGGTAREVTTADLAAPRDLLPARRPAGVGMGMVHGNGQRAGAGAPEVRPTGSRKRKRDGGVGSPMIPA